MLSKLFKYKRKVILAISLISLLVFIREFESKLFYDPFLAFFKSDYAHQSLPNYNLLELFLNLLFRYGLNTIISLALLYVIFADKEMIQFSAILYGIFFVVLSMLFCCILVFEKQNYLLLFYVRRFLIQPIFILLFIPGFYYQKQLK